MSRKPVSPPVRTVVLLVFGLLPELAEGSPCDRAANLRSISYTGNEVTRPQTMQRELTVQTGQEISVESVSTSRQAIQDLGLFRSVMADCEYHEDGVDLNFSLKEKYFVIPVPRFDANSDGQTAWGAQVRWYNVLGRNHSFSTKILRSQKKEVGRGASTSFDLGYGIPYLGASPWGVKLDYSHVEQAVNSDRYGDYSETTDAGQLLLQRDLDFGKGPASQGATLSAGLGWTEARVTGDQTIPAPGQALRFPFKLSKSRRHYNVFSDVGWEGSVSAGFSHKDLGSSYSQTGFGASAWRSWAVGNVPHQTLELSLDLANQVGGASDERFAYSVGGSKSLRGFDLNRLRGDGFFEARAEFYRPLGIEWLRFGPFLELGSTWRGPDDQPSTLLADAGLGFQVRISWFVNAELNFGYAVPLSESGPGQFYARGK